MSAKEEFIEIYTSNIHREGADALLDYLEHKSDFFTSPASARYHGAYEGGLCDHSVNVYHCLTEYLARERVQELYGVEVAGESVARLGYGQILERMLRMSFLLEPFEG